MNRNTLLRTLEASTEFTEERRKAILSEYDTVTTPVERQAIYDAVIRNKGGAVHGGKQNKLGNSKHTA